MVRAAVAVLFLTVPSVAVEGFNGQSFLDASQAFSEGYAFGFLGSVDEVPHPKTDGCDEYEADVAVGGLVVSSGESAAVLEL